MQTEQGAWEPILPMPELERMYQRILAQELVVSEPQTAPCCGGRWGTPEARVAAAEQGPGCGCWHKADDAPIQVTGCVPHTHKCE